MCPLACAAGDVQRSIPSRSDDVKQGNVFIELCDSPDSCELLSATRLRHKQTAVHSFVPTDLSRVTCREMSSQESGRNMSSGGSLTAAFSVGDQSHEQGERQPALVHAAVKLLELLGLPQCGPCLVLQHIFTVADIAELSDEDFKSLGLNIGQKNRVRKAAQQNKRARRNT